MVPDESMYRYTVCVTPTGRRKHWGNRISAQHPLARAGAAVGTLEISCQPPAYSVVAAAAPEGCDLGPCAWCARNIHPF